MATQPFPYSAYQDPTALLTQYDEQGNVIQPNQYGQVPGAFGYVPPNSITTPTGSSPSSVSAIYGAPAAAPAYNGARNDSIGAQVSQNQNYENQAGQQINQEAEAQLPYYSGLQTQFQQEASSALNQLGATPGYTPGEASQINVNYGQFNTPESTLDSEYLTPAEQTSIYGNPQVGAQVTDAGLKNEGAQLGAYEQNLSGQVGNFANYAKQGVQDLSGGLQTANSGLQSGLQGAQGKFGNLDTAVNNPALAFDPNGTEKQITDAQVQDMRTSAGQAVGAQYQTAENQLQRQAANAGNSSPLAIAAANARLQQQEAAGEGNAEVAANIAALQAQQQQAASIEQQREGAAQTQTGFKANAATTEEQAAQNAAALAGTTGVTSAALTGTQGLAAAEQTAQKGIDAANTYGQTAINEQNLMTGQQAGADTLAEQEAAARAASIAGNRQTTGTSINQTKYGQGVGSQQDTSQGAQTVGGARIGGQQNYLAGVTGQQGMAQQGGQAAVGQQQNAFSTETGGLGQGATTLANYKVSAPTAISQASSLIGAVAPKGLAEGGVASKPEVHIVGEKGPELIMPLGRYRAKDRKVA